jgi:hypothetical protein
VRQANPSDVATLDSASFLSLWRYVSSVVGACPDLVGVLFLFPGFFRRGCLGEGALVIRITRI